MDKLLSVEVIGWPGDFSQLPEKTWALTGDKLIVIAIPHQQVSELSCPMLDSVKLVQLAESLVAIAGIPDYTPTAFGRPIPLRLGVMLNRLLDQPSAFLSPLLRNWCEWFGLHPPLAISQAWADFAVANATAPDGISELFDKLVKRNLIYVDGENFYLPLPIAVALASDTQLPGWDILPELLHKLRHTLLRNERTDSIRQWYQQITAFLRMPHPSLEGHPYRIARARGALVDLANYDLSNGVFSPVVDAILIALQSLYESNAIRYQAVFNRVHGPIWDSVAQAINELEEIDSHIQGQSLTIDTTSYADSSRLVSRELRSISKAYTILTEFETKLGVDRYLGGQALNKDLALIRERVRRIARCTHGVLDEPRQVYLRQWNLANIEAIVLRLLNLADDSGRLTGYFPSDQQRVIFLLIDALGYTQFQWFLNVVAQRAAIPLANNIFAWLQEQAAFNSNYLLASNLVSITGACLPTIYTGALPRETGVVGSHMMMEGHRLNVLTGIDEHHKLSGSEVDEVYRRNVNLGLTPFAQRAYDSGVDVKIFHGGSMRFNPLADFTYGKLRKQGLVNSVSRADRIFSEALPEVLAWVNMPRRKRLALLYYPLIDHSGHGCGPYTQFQIAELNKLNFVFTHFLIDIVREAEELFDGHTSILITADHGMFESASTAVSHHMVRYALGGKTACRDMSFIYDNRAMYIYGVDTSSLESVRRDLIKYFSANELSISVSTRKDPLVRDLLCTASSPWAVNCPDIILQFYGPGVFYFNEDLPSHMFLYGAHGGTNVEETFVPLIHFILTPDLAIDLKQFF
jgi:hypothetical protein